MSPRRNTENSYCDIMDNLYDFTLMLLTAKLANTKLCKNPEKPLKPLANGYSSQSAKQELSNEYQHDRVLMVLKNLCIFVLWAQVATALIFLSIWLLIHYSTIWMGEILD